MGATNAMTVYTRWAGRLPATAMQCLVYMALVSKDSDRHPWYGMGHEALATLALDRQAPITPADLRAVERAMTALHAAGAIRVERRAAVRRDGPSTARYRLLLDPVEAMDARHFPSDVPAGYIDESIVDNPPERLPDETSRPTKSDAHARRFSDSRPTKSGAHARRKPSDRGDTRNHEEREEEEVVGVDAAVTASRANDSAAEPPLILRSIATPPGVPLSARCDRHPALPAGRRRDGKPACDLCRTQGRPPPHDTAATPLRRLLAA